MTDEQKEVERKSHIEKKGVENQYRKKMRGRNKGEKQI